MKTETAPVRLAEYRAPDFRIDTVNLDFRLDPTATRVTARLKIRRVSGNGPLVLAGDELSLSGLKLDGALVPQDQYDVNPHMLRLDKVPAGPFTLEIVTEINPSANTKLMGLYRSSETWCTQCEAEGFRRITYFLDRPDVLSVYTTRIEARKADAPVLLGNGNPVETGDIPDTDRHFAVWHDPFPKPAYLFALVAGDLGRISDTFTTMSGKKVDLNIWCEHGKEARCGHAMELLKNSMAWDETAFGREYDLDVFNVVAVSDFNMGAMENKGLNVFNDRYVLAEPDTATDVDYAHIEGVIAHEYFHNWTGNRVTCRDWFQLCLKEGLTVYRDQEFSSDMQSRPVKRIDDVRTLKARQFPEDGGPLAHPVRPEIYHEINNFYTATVYEKGAELVRMIRTILGPEGFRKGMDLYFERHDGEAATVEDFLAAFADANKVDLSHFKLWYSQAGTPEIVARGTYDAGARRYTLSLAQTTRPTPGQPTKAPLHVPVRFGLIGPNGDDLAYASVDGARVTGDVIHLTSEAQTVTFSGVSTRPVPSLFRDFSAPVRLSLDLDAEDLLFMLRMDRDPFNRWQAAQTLEMRALTAAVAAVKAGRPATFDPALIDALGAVADNDGLDAALRAQVLTLPGESEIAREIGRDVDPDAVAAARNGLRAAAGRRLGDKLRRLYERLASTGAYQPNAAGTGRRSLRNAALDYLVASGDTALAKAQFDAADNMTDRAAALAILNQALAPERTAALAAFHKRYRNDALVLDKWLALEATAPSPATLNRVRELMADPAFSMSNPNRLRSLIGSFAAANQTQFNRADGAGFDFVADVVINLDPRNPQTAARIMTSFRSWRALEEGRRGKAEAALRRIAAVENLSPDVSDLVTRMLA